MESRRESVRENGEIRDLFEGLVLVRELQQVPVRVRHQDELAWPPAAHPATYVHISIGTAGAVRIHVQADTGAQERADDDFGPS
jgi:hypothetical protein